MLVHDVMSTGVVKAKKTDTVRSVVMKMLSRNCGAIPVVEDDDRLVGMVTVRDVLLPLYPTMGTTSMIASAAATSPKWRKATPTCLPRRSKRS